MPRPPIAAPTLLLFAALTGAGCSRNLAARPPAQVCAARDSLDRLKQAAFDAAAAEASSQSRYALEHLGSQAQAKVVDPLVESFDRDTRKTVCTATLEVWLPPGALSRRDLRAPVRYASQPTADGRSIVFTPSGLEPVASAIAEADVSAWAEKNAPSRPGLTIEVVPRLDTAANTLHARTPTTAPAVPGLRPTVLPAPRPPVVPASRPAPSPAPAPAPAPALPPPASPPPASPPPTVALAAGARPVRVFVHIADPSQTAAADQVRADLHALDIAGQAVETPPVRFVPRLPRRTEVRCLKQADCPAAREVARSLAHSLGQAVAVVDMSATYETDPGVRPGSLELWLSPAD